MKPDIVSRIWAVLLIGLFYMTGCSASSPINLSHSSNPVGYQWYEKYTTNNRRTLDQQNTVKTNASNISKGWSGFKWGVPFEHFITDFPNCRHRKGDKLVEGGEGHVSFCRLWVKPYYGFNKNNRFYKLILLPRMKDRPHVNCSIFKTLGLQANEDGIAQTGSLQFEINQNFRIIMITNIDYEK